MTLTYELEDLTLNKLSSYILLAALDSSLSTCEKVICVVLYTEVIVIQSNHKEALP